MWFFTKRAYTSDFYSFKGVKNFSYTIVNFSKGIFLLHNISHLPAVKHAQM
jgi:hypothetical protein